MCMVPTWTGKPAEHFSIREKSGNFANTGKVKEFYPKYFTQVPTWTGKLGTQESIFQSGKSQGILLILEKSEKFLSQ